MTTPPLVEWQKYAPNGFVYPWWTHPFLDVLETWDLKEKNWLEFGAGRSTAWLRSKCAWVDSIESNLEWANTVNMDCYLNNLTNGEVHHWVADLADGIAHNQPKYFNLIPKDKQYNIISVDGIYRNECLQWALDHFKGRGGILIADNFDQDYVWISPAAVELMAPYKEYEHIFYQPGHTNHEGKSWNTRYWEIPA